MPLTPASRPYRLHLLGAIGLSLAAGLSGMAARVHAQGAVPSGPPRTAGDRPTTQRLVMATYYYSFQADRRKQLPVQDVRSDKGQTLLTNHPWESVGPWFSYDRAQWHKNQFQMLAAGGVDVAMAVYRGDPANRKTYALKGLDVMTQALKELRSGGLAPLMKVREYPQIGLTLDLGGLEATYGGPVDLKQPEVQRSLYGMIRDFYSHIPEEFRATIQLPRARMKSFQPVVGANGQQLPGLAPTNSPLGVGYPVRLINDAAVKDADNSFLTYVNRRFAQEMGAGLLWVGTPALKEKVSELDGTAPNVAALASATVSRDGWLSIGAVSPGYDSTGLGPNGQIRPRENGVRLITEFRKAMAANPDWVLIDSWNGYAQGSDVAPSLQYGLLYRDLIRAGVLQYKQSADYAADFLKASVPRVVQPGTVYKCEVTLQNSGTYDWDAFNVASLSYRWVKDGKYVGEQGVQIPASAQNRGDKRSILMGITAPFSVPDPDKPAVQLPPGDYEIEFNMTRRVGDETVWFDLSEMAPFRVPVTVGPAPAARPCFISTTLTSMMKRGATYPTRVRLRNDGSDVWKKGAVSLGYRWRKASTYLKGYADDSDAVVSEGKRVALPAEVQPGSMIEVEVPVQVVDARNQPLPVSSGEAWNYVLEWDVFAGGKFLSASGGAVSREPVVVVDRDPAAAFIGCNLPSDLVAGRTEKITVGLQNNGPDEWKKGRDKVAVHWYYMDGTEASFNDDTLPLQDDVPPFSLVEMDVPESNLLGTTPTREKDKKDKDKDKDKDDKVKTRREWVVQPTVLRDVPVRVPYYFGPMYCVLDFQQDGVNASTGAASKGNDLLVIPVNVFSPTFTPLPSLAAYYNTDGMSQDVDRSDGNLDGRGNSFPAEFLPPYVPRPSVGAGPSLSPLYPSGLWVRPLNDLEGTRVCFFYPSKNNATPNMVACEGQKIEFAGLQRTAVHILAACTEENIEGAFSLYYSDGTVERKNLKFTHWNEAPRNGERVAFRTPHRHTRAGDDPATSCYLNQYSLPTEGLKLLTGIELPRQRAIKVMAITLESATLRRN